LKPVEFSFPTLRHVLRTTSTKWQLFPQVSTMMLWTAPLAAGHESRSKWMANRTKPGRIVNLYWVVTDDHDEDWFILARTARTAESYHIQYEGYEPGDARAELILRAGTDSIPGPIPRHAQLEDLQMLGFEILNPDPNGRSARRNDRTFLEGHLESMVAEVRDDARRSLGRVGLGEPLGAAQTSDPCEVGIVTSNYALFAVFRMWVRMRRGASVGLAVFGRLCAIHRRYTEHPLLCVPYGSLQGVTVRPVPCDYYCASPKLRRALKSTVYTTSSIHHFAMTVPYVPLSPPLVGSNPQAFSITALRQQLRVFKRQNRRPKLARPR
jgi:hypothetical protein